MTLTEHIAREFDRIHADITENNPSMDEWQVVEETLSMLVDAGLIVLKPRDED